MSHLKKTLIASALLLAIGSEAQAVELPHTFQAGSSAVAAEVNANFSALATAITTLQEEIATLNTALADSQVQVTALEDEVTTLNTALGESQAQVTALEQQLTAAENFLSLKDYVSLVPDPYISNEHTVRFSSVNVQIVNGTYSQHTVNGLGNLIVGYNESRHSGANVCSIGQWDNELGCLGGGGVWAQNHKSGSHNIVGGHANAYSSYGGFVLGKNNAINFELSSVSGGEENISSGEGSSVLGGFQEVATSPTETVPPIPSP